MRILRKKKSMRFAQFIVSQKHRIRSSGSSNQVDKFRMKRIKILLRFAQFIVSRRDETRSRGSSNRIN